MAESNSLSEVTESSPNDNDTNVTKPVSRLTRWFRSPLFNVIIVGFISFTQPGIWNALNSTGAGGQQEPYLVNGANSLTFGIMVFGCSIFSMVANKIGINKVLIIGTLGYAPYSAALYVNNRYGTEWFVLFGGATCGIAASALWASEGAIALGYGDVRNRGKYTGIWLGLRELGQLLGSSIQLSLNVKDGNRGKVSYTTYLVLISLQCLGLPLSLLISPPEKIIRSDGSMMGNAAIASREKTVKATLKSMWALLKRKQMFLLIPVMVGFNWNSTYLGIYQTAYFSVRARTLSSLVSGIVATMANIIWGWVFDLKRFSRPVLAKFAWGFSATTMLGLMSWQIANEKYYADAVPAVTLDWANSGFGRGFASMVLIRFFNESHYMFIYWIIGAFFDDLETLTLAVGMVRSFESLGSTVAFGIGAAKVSPMANLVVAFVLLCITIPTTTLAVLLVPERPEQTKLIEETEEDEPAVETITESTGVDSKGSTA
ncbi:Ion channel regulatory protein UNC-93 [Geosmithia morbida]|uniref:Ion channel regulatory protein UNC-93 n=1 Tax=Geosmithia morbida TaxID=1094350 RepID=A0A9P4Z2U1_9HYPO|nr:Ion channel regulatory protein UNC-93 [Geosmithia morbida]KAF4126399.1 Ion channel regulatory protein UNC-93 [Geosmithia morbida]